MAKRNVSSDEELDAGSASYEDRSADESQPPAKKAKKTPEKKANVPKKDSGEKKAASKKAAGKKTPSIASKNVQQNVEGEKYVDLGKKRRATVRSFKGKTLIDIREFYGEDGDEKPGKKGISLSIEEWHELRDNAGTIDGLVEKLK